MNVSGVEDILLALPTPKESKDIIDIRNPELHSSRFIEPQKQQKSR